MFSSNRKHAATKLERYCHVSRVRSFRFRHSRTCKLRSLSFRRSLSERHPFPSQHCSRHIPLSPPPQTCSSPAPDAAAEDAGPCQPAWLPFPDDDCTSSAAADAASPPLSSLVCFAFRLPATVPQKPTASRFCFSTIFRSRSVAAVGTPRLGEPRFDRPPASHHITGCGRSSSSSLLGLRTWEISSLMEDILPCQGAKL